MTEERRHPKTNRPIWNKPISVDERGVEVYECFYSKHPIAFDKAIYIGPCIPQAIGTYVCHPEHGPAAFRESKRSFDELDANCNACKHFERQPHEKNHGFVKGKCDRLPAVIDNLIYRRNGQVFWVHPDDCMGMPCWEARPAKVK